jgi:serine/threonine-protein kinase
VARNAVLGQLRKQPGGLPHGQRAKAYALLGEREAALAELDQAVAQRDPNLESIKSDPPFASLRTDPRFAALLARIGLPP